MDTANNAIESIIKSCYEVHNELGVGFLEKVFENALLIALRDNGHTVLQQAPLSVFFREQVVGEYFADLLVDDSFVIEVKAVKTLLPEHQAQLINYLNATKFDNGLLVNFGVKGLELKRSYRKSR